jgi:hypothetical protein
MNKVLFSLILANSLNVFSAQQAQDGLANNASKPNLSVTIDDIESNIVRFPDRPLSQCSNISDVSDLSPLNMESTSPVNVDSDNKQISAANLQPSDDSYVRVESNEEFFGPSFESPKNAQADLSYDAYVAPANAHRFQRATQEDAIDCSAAYAASSSSVSCAAQECDERAALQPDAMGGSSDANQQQNMRQLREMNEEILGHLAGNSLREQLTEMDEKRKQENKDESTVVGQATPSNKKSLIEKLKNIDEKTHLTLAALLSSYVGYTGNLKPLYALVPYALWPYLKSYVSSIEFGEDSYGFLTLKSARYKIICLFAFVGCFANAEFRKEFSKPRAQRSNLVTKWFF